MEAVVDQFDLDPPVFQHRRYGTGITVPYAIHRVEHMREDSRPRIDAAFRHGIVGIAMSDRGNHPCLAETAYRLNAMRQLGRDGDLPYASLRGFQQPVHHRRFRVAQTIRIMRAFARKRQKRTLQMGAQTVRAKRALPGHRSHIRAHHVKRVRDQTQHLTGGAMHRMPGPCRGDPLVAVIE